MARTEANALKAAIEQMKKDIESGEFWKAIERYHKKHGAKSYAGGCHEMPNMDDDYNYKHYYEITER